MRGTRAQMETRKGFMTNWRDEFDKLIKTKTQLLLTDGDTLLRYENLVDIQKIKDFIIQIEHEAYEKGKAEERMGFVKNSEIILEGVNEIAEYIKALQYFYRPKENEEGPHDGQN